MTFMCVLCLKLHQFFTQNVERALRGCSACPAEKASEDGDGSIRCLLLGGGLMAGPQRGAAQPAAAESYNKINLQQRAHGNHTGRRGRGNESVLQGPAGPLRTELPAV